MAGDFSARMREALQTALAGAGCALEPDICDYLVESCGGVLEDADDITSAEADIHELLQPHLEDAGAEEAQMSAVTIALVSTKFASAKDHSTAIGSHGEDARGVGVGTKVTRVIASETAKDEELLCAVPDLLLMYGGGSSALLKSTRFELRRAHRYGIVGRNGAGKTTLMAALLGGAVEALPKSLNIVHVHGGTVAEMDDSQTTPLDLAGQRREELIAACRLGPAAAEVGIPEALAEVGFSAEMQSKALSQLSGGWRMRLVLACAMMECPELLLLDEPTNHLDTDAIKWLGNYMQGFTGTSMIISHEPDFLNDVCTDIIHFDAQKLNYYAGNFTAFLNQTSLSGDAAQAVLETKHMPFNVAAKAIQGGFEQVKLTFPIPGKLDGVNSQTKPICEMKDASFRWTEEGPMVLKRCSAKLALGSRVAVVGANGAGKSTLLSLLCGETAPVEDEGCIGEVMRHRNLRLSYIAQHHTFHLEEFLKCTPVHYFQLRFKNGYDEQLQIRLRDLGSEEEKQQRSELARKHGKQGRPVREVVGRQKRGKEIAYEIAWDGLNDAKQNTFETLDKLRLLRMDGYARAFDERAAAQAAGTHERPLTDREIVKHCDAFQMTPDMCTRQMISSFSGGQKARLMLAAAFWTKPHMIALDEPTNYLDPETVDSLAKALKNFRGGVIAITHSSHFVDQVCNESWLVHDGGITVSAISPAPAVEEDCTKPVSESEPTAEAAGEAQLATPLSAAAAAAASVKVTNGKATKATNGKATKSSNRK